MRSGAVARAARRELPVNPTEHFPDIYGLLCEGDCMAPEIPDKSKVAASKTVAYAAGRIVVVWLRPEAVRPGHPPGLIKRLLYAPLPGTTFPYRENPKSEVRALVGLGMNTEPGKVMFVKCADIVAMHTVVALCVPGDDRYRPFE